jgi:hypothetical protein
VKLLAAIRKRAPAPAEPLKAPPEPNRELADRGRRLVAERGIEPGGIYTVRGQAKPHLIDHIDYRLAGLGEPCLIGYPAPRDWRNDKVLSLDDVLRPA